MIVIKAALRFTILDSLRISSIDLIISDFSSLSPSLCAWLHDFSNRIQHTEINSTQSKMESNLKFLVQ